MTCDERLEALLNRAGQTISDLPERYDERLFNDVTRVADAWSKWTSPCPRAEYILHLTDVIDRMETAMENVIGERDWLLKHHEGCDGCALDGSDDCPVMQGGLCGGIEWKGVPDDWRADDD